MYTPAQLKITQALWEQCGVRNLSKNGYWQGDDTVLGKIQGMCPEPPRYTVVRHHVAEGEIEIYFHDLDLT